MYQGRVAPEYGLELEPPGKDTADVYPSRKAYGTTQEERGISSCSQCPGIGVGNFQADADCDGSY